ncbi:DUF4276 family protein [Argonema galeatum]|uniref:DUF4276 family protein n=1 Tax=Argonema galeatum TaxID=2942762 RepID=UPI002011C851|nr:DUF4276 family protein [Argonema galeatum]MCL1465575.1 DUF4276 family protein [Argonema galeatum A003/A1]
MAVVVWVFAGGGESEVKGLTQFLDKNFPGCQFIRKTPIRQKPGPKPNKALSYGRTGQSLIEQIKEELPIALRVEPNRCDLILVFDDLDCRDRITQRQKILEEIAKISECDNIEKFVGFAAPELEAWIIGDWNNTVANHLDFRDRHQRMRWWLSTKRNIPFNNPESFSEYDPERDCCREKLSEALIESTVQDADRDKPRFSKGLHTPELITQINCGELQRKCPLFRELYNYLNHFCQNS